MISDYYTGKDYTDKVLRDIKKDTFDFVGKKFNWSSYKKYININADDIIEVTDIRTPKYGIRYHKFRVDENDNLDIVFNYVINGVVKSYDISIEEFIDAIQDGIIY